MNDVLLVAYHAEATAAFVLEELRRTTTGPATDILSAASVRIDADRRFTVTTTDWPGSGDPFWGVLWEAFFGMVFLVPERGCSYGANLGGLFGAIDRAGLNQHVRTQIRDVLEPQTSGLGILLGSASTDVATALRNSPAIAVIEASLTLDPTSELGSELGVSTPTTFNLPAPHGARNG